MPDSDDQWRWLIAGPEADPAGADAVVGRSVRPEIRAIDNPEIVVREAPMIVVYGTPAPVEPESPY